MHSFQMKEMWQCFTLCTLNQVHKAFKMLWLSCYSLGWDEALHYFQVVQPYVPYSNADFYMQNVMHTLMHVSSEVSPTAFNGGYTKESMYRTAALI